MFWRIFLKFREALEPLWTPPLSQSSALGVKHSAWQFICQMKTGPDSLTAIATVLTSGETLATRQTALAGGGLRKRKIRQQLPQRRDWGKLSKIWARVCAWDRALPVLASQAPAFLLPYDWSAQKGKRVACFNAGCSSRTPSSPRQTGRFDWRNFDRLSSLPGNIGSSFEPGLDSATLLSRLQANGYNKAPSRGMPPDSRRCPRSLSSLGWSPLPTSKEMDLCPSA